MAFSTSKDQFVAALFVASTAGGAHATCLGEALDSVARVSSKSSTPNVVSKPRSYPDCLSSEALTEWSSESTSGTTEFDSEDEESADILSPLLSDSFSPGFERKKATYEQFVCSVERQKRQRMQKKQRELLLQQSQVAAMVAAAEAEALKALEAQRVAAHFAALAEELRQRLRAMSMSMPLSSESLVV